MPYKAIQIKKLKLNINSIKSVMIYLIFSLKRENFFIINVGKLVKDVNNAESQERY